MRPKTKLFEDENIAILPDLIAEMMNVSLKDLLTPGRNQPRTHSDSRSVLIGLASEISGMKVAGIAAQYGMGNSAVKSAIMRHEVNIETGYKPYVRAYEKAKEAYENHN